MDITRQASLPNRVHGEITRNRNVRGLLGLWRRRSRTRRRLVELDARELSDIGFTDAQRLRECAKWFWQS
jgi:uncharacterized protein YjiS (DUF1127 family)